MGSPDRPSKQDAFLALLAEGWTSLHLDARREGVVVPEHLKNEAHLVLQYGHDLPIPIPDLQIDEHGVSATLSFARIPWSTVIPWSAVYVVTSADGRGVLYKEDVPGDVSVLAGSANEAPAGAEATQPETAGSPGAAGGTEGPGGEPQPGPRRPTPARALRAVPLAETVDESALGLNLLGGTTDDELVPARRRKRPQLRLVK
jgi:stringent starvation protein B